MMFTIEELLQLWTNDTTRREFVKDFKMWGVWFTQPELNLTYYKYDLPSGGRIIAMEYLREPYASERHNGSDEAVICNDFYLQLGKFFTPQSSSEGFIAGHLKDIKEDLKKKNRKCSKCGSGSFQHKQDGSVLCSVCSAVISKPNDVIGVNSNGAEGTNKLILNYRGRDSWDRPIYECEGRLYVDIDPRADMLPSIHTKSGNEFDGEPDYPIEADVKVEFVPARDTW